MTTEREEGEAIVLMSGGIDSAACFGHACERYDKVTAIHIDYGQQTGEVEVGMARRQVQNMMSEHPEVEVEMLDPVDYRPVFSQFADGVADPDKEFDHMTEDDGRSSGYVPMRNLHLLATAAAFADSRGAKAIYHGAQAGDNADYPDCRPEFMDRAASAVNKSIPDGQSILVRVPLLKRPKHEVLKIGRIVGVDYSFTYSCYTEVEDPDNPEPCGACPACEEREEAFERVDFSDPLVGDET